MAAPNHPPGRIFLLSPAKCSGLRARLLVSGRGNFELSQRLGRGEAIELGEAFTWLSALYFRGKLTYARAFARPPPGVAGDLVITPDRGLVSAAERVQSSDLLDFAKVDIDHRDERFFAPLRRHADALASLPATEIVLLGSIASAKYVHPLLEALGDRLLFPPDFVGRGDMSRGGLLLRCVRAGEELSYAKVAGATRRGPRVPKLPRLGARSRKRQDDGPGAGE